VGLGGLGIVTEVTLQCVPAHQLLEHTFVCTPAEIRKNHTRWLQENKHMRYMWIPSTDAVVVVQCNPLNGKEIPKQVAYPESFRLEPLRNLARTQGHDAPDHMNFAQLRDLLLRDAVLDAEYVRSVNRAEAEFWKRSEGYRVDYSDRVLGFECGGQQWVWEVAFPTGSLANPTGSDLDYVEELMRGIEEMDLPAPAPIEQRWTSSSTSLMSPASSADPATVHSWVGIIMYLPTEDPGQRCAITSKFQEYCAMEARQMDKYSATSHWAKLEVPGTEVEIASMQEALQKRYPVDKFNQARKELDPKNILANRWLDTVFATA